MSHSEQIFMKHSCLFMKIHVAPQAKKHSCSFLRPFGGKRQSQARVHHFFRPGRVFICFICFFLFFKSRFSGRGADIVGRFFGKKSPPTPALHPGCHLAGAPARASRQRADVHPCALACAREENRKVYLSYFLWAKSLETQCLYGKHRKHR